MIHILGYIGLALNLLSMTMKNILWLRILSALANFLYVIYAIIIESPPLMIGCAIAVIIHCYHIVKLIKNKNTKDTVSDNILP